MTTVGIYLYFLFGTVLFFFWVYGIVSFVVDVRRQVIPWVQAHWQHRKDDSDEEVQLNQLTNLYGPSEEEE